jgi:hypothetical protein
LKGVSLPHKNANVKLEVADKGSGR